MKLRDIGTNRAKRQLNDHRRKYVLNMARARDKHVSNPHVVTRVYNGMERSFVSQDVVSMAIELSGAEIDENT